MSEIQVENITARDSNSAPNFSGGITFGGLSADSAMPGLLTPSITVSNIEPDSATVTRGNFWFNDSGSGSLSLYNDGVWWTLGGQVSSGGSAAADGWYGDRAVFGGGYTSGSQYNENGIDYKSITVSAATASDFGDLTTARVGLFSGSDGTTGLFYGGYAQGVSNKTSIDYVTIATAGNATDWGGTTSSGFQDGGSYCDTTRHVVGGANYGGSNSSSNRIDYFTTTIGSSSSQFGTLTLTAYKRAATNDATRGLFGGGYYYTTQSNYYNTIDYITTASAANSTDFGDLTVARYEFAAASSTTTAFFIAGGDAVNSNAGNTIDYVTIQTTGNATDWGDTSVAIRGCSGVSDGSDYCLHAGGSLSSGTTNTVGRFSMTTSGNAADWGDLARDRFWNKSCSGD